MPLTGTDRPRRFPAPARPPTLSLDPSLVAARLRRLDPGARAAVLADCRRARGESVERDGATVRTRRGDETLVLATVAPTIEEAHHQVIVVPEMPVKAAPAYP